MRAVRDRGTEATLLVVAAVALLSSAAASDAAAVRGQRLQLVIGGTASEPAELCGRLRAVAIVPPGTRLVAVVRGARRAAPRLIVERCVDGRWSQATRHRMTRRGAGYRTRINARAEGDYRVQARARGARSRPAYLRVGRGELRVRKDVANLTAGERSNFVQALLRLKATPSPYDSGLSYYDQFVAWHQTLSRCDPRDPLLTRAQMAHLGPMFLPWHRLFVLLLERALREVSGKDIAVPYWDWTDPKSTKAVFADDFMGGDGDPDGGYAVTTGPFRKGRWQLNVHPVGLQWASSASSYITRHFGSFPAVDLPTPEDVRLALQAPLYDISPYSQESDADRSFRNALEGFRPPLSAALICGPDGVVIEPGRPPQELHNAVHIWVGGRIAPEAGGQVIGTMFNVTSSPNDPVFFVHHSMVDRIWAEWQERHGVDTYMPRSGFANNNIDDVMRPFDEDGLRFTPQDIADIRRLGYRYDHRRSGRSRTRLGPGAHSRIRFAPLQPGIPLRCGLAR